MPQYNGFWPPYRFAPGSLLSISGQAPEFDADLSDVAKKLLLTVYSHRTVQMLTLKLVTTEVDTRLLAMAEDLVKKYAGLYLDAMVVFVKVRQVLQLRPEKPEEANRMIEK